MYAIFVIEILLKIQSRECLAIDILKIKELSHVRWLLMPLWGESFVKSIAVKTQILNAYSSISSHYYLIYPQRGEM